MRSGLRVGLIGVGVLTFAIGCLANYFWDLNFAAPVTSSPAGCVSTWTPTNESHLITGVLGLFLSLLLLVILSPKIARWIQSVE